jgi:hypothetical protein
MIRRTFAAIALVACALACASHEARAVYITSNGSIEAEDGFGASAGSGPPLTDIWRVGNVGGKAYTNFAIPNAMGTFGVGAEIRTVSAEIVQTAQDGTTFTPVGIGDFTIVAFSAQRAIVRGFAGSSPVLDVVEGRLFLAMDLSVAGIDVDDPSTWLSSFTGGVFAEYVLGPREAIVSGSTFGIAPASASGLPLAPSLVNAQTPDAVDAPKAQLNLVFLEDSTAAQNAGVVVDSGLETYDTGDNWLHDVDSAGLLVLDEGFFVQVATTIQSQTLAQISADDPTGFSDVDVSVLNLIADASGPGFTDLDGVAPGEQAFASLYASGLGQTTVYSPGGGIGAGFNGDAVSTFSSDAFPVIQAVLPEPASITLLAFGSLGFIASARGWRRRRSQA